MADEIEHVEGQMDLLTPELFAEVAKAATTSADRLRQMSAAALDAYENYRQRVMTAFDVEMADAIHEGLMTGKIERPGLTIDWTGQ